MLTFVPAIYTVLNVCVVVRGCFVAAVGLEVGAGP